ncbi:MAG TPA: hypothetical protein VE733_17465 [Streptosporangiaceae bacterium]|nr:hypothetical protein [Streptosporangiaceae bacterium]
MESVDQQPGPCARAVGYSVILPPSWAKIPLRNGTDAAVRRILDRSFAGFSRDQVAQQRHELRERLGKLIASAKSNAGLDLYLPVELMRGLAVPASFLVSEGAFDAGPETPPEEIVAVLAARGADASLTEVDGAIGVRQDKIVPPDRARDIQYGSRHVDYTLAVPGDTRRWLVIAFSTIGAGDPGDDIAQLLTGLFDAVMTTFRWRHAQ